MKNCISTLQKWQKKVFRRADLEILKLKEKLKDLQNQEYQLTNGEEMKKL